MQHISWQNDSLKIEFAIAKGNQDGEREERKLLFANPLNPFICPVLALSLYFANSSKVFKPEDRLFSSAYQSDTFLKTLQRALETEFIRNELVVWVFTRMKSVPTLFEREQLVRIQFNLRINGDL